MTLVDVQLTALNAIFNQGFVAVAAFQHLEDHCIRLKAFVENLLVGHPQQAGVLHHADYIGVRAVLVRAEYEPLTKGLVGPGDKTLVDSDLDELIDIRIQVRKGHHWLVEELGQHLCVEGLLELITLVWRQGDLLVLRCTASLLTKDLNTGLLIFTRLGHGCQCACFLLSRTRPQFLGLHNETLLPDSC
jgi:hypothetical protein